MSMPGPGGNADWLARSRAAVFHPCTQMKVHETLPLVPVARGEGAWLFDFDGRRYLDLLSGIGVASLGHAHPGLASAIADQASTLLHTSNLYYTENQVLLAEELKGLTGMDRAYFCNSGAESIEAALKLVRRATGRAKIVAARIVMANKRALACRI